MKEQRSFPIIEYAHKIKKNTAEFTVNDLVAFMKWWVKQPVRKDILAMKNEYVNKQKNKMGSNKVHQDIDNIVEPPEEEQEQEQSAVVAEIGFTQLDIDAMKWALAQIFENYDLTDSAYETPLTELKESLDSL